MRSPSKNNINSSNSNIGNSLNNRNYSNTNVTELPILKQNSNSIAESAFSEANVTSGSSSTNSSSSQSNVNANSSNLSGELSEQITNGAAIDSALRKYGWLHKLSQNGLKLWRKRYFVLTDYILDYYSGKKYEFRNSNKKDPFKNDFNLKLKFRFNNE